MKELCMTGEEFIKLGIKQVCKNNKVEYYDGLVIPHINYDSNINDNYEYSMIRGATHDGTLFFTLESLYNMFGDFIFHRTYYKPTFENISVDNNIKNLKYTIGDVFVENTYDVKVEGKNFTMMSQTFTIPVKTELIIK